MQKSDFRVMVVCLTLIVCLGGVYVLIDKNVQIEKVADKTNILHKEKGKHQKYYSDYKQQETTLQHFDPNTADSTTLLALGLPPFIVRSIYKYRSMGGVYSTPEDFARIPGLTQLQYKRLRPFIRISDDYRPASLLVGERKANNTEYTEPTHDTTQDYQKKMLPTERLSLNTADTTALKTVPGIGSYYARRIVELRERLGGFISLDQLFAIKNFPESALQYLTIPDGGIKKININRATFKQLSTHPYIGYNRTKGIMDYRKLKGQIHSLKDLSLLPGFTEEEISRMEPYIEF